MRTSEQEVAAYTFLTPTQVSKRLNCTPQHVTTLIRAGKLAAVNIAVSTGRPAYRIAPVAVDAYLANTIVTPEAA